MPGLIVACLVVISIVQLLQAERIIGSPPGGQYQRVATKPFYTPQCREKSLNAHFAVTLELRSNADGGGMDSPGHYEYCEPAMDIGDCLSMARAHAASLGQIHAVNGFEWQCGAHQRDDYNPTNYGSFFRANGGELREMTHFGDPLTAAPSENKS